MAKMTRELRSEIKLVCAELVTEEIISKIPSSALAEMNAKMETISSKLSKLDILDFQITFDISYMYSSDTRHFRHFRHPPS